ncbi:hypothetical protein EVAR_8443_1 [Eumeta japonica]|uniref:Uncharacterized protein n=1 Tax=Eumeta variegata TaxID=151549 RepID=A0A4C1WFD4_EUMVA|nr:hypothetical protein EVAR_8443_1 [Eumeta japonica]
MMEGERGSGPLELSFTKRNTTVKAPTTRPHSVRVDSSHLRELDPTIKNLSALTRRCGGGRIESRALPGSRHDRCAFSRFLRVSTAGAGVTQKMNREIRLMDTIPYHHCRPDNAVMAGSRARPFASPCTRRPSVCALLTTFLSVWLSIIAVSHSSLILYFAGRSHYHLIGSCFA